MPRYLTVVPAYGRDYKSAGKVREDWKAGKDFLIYDAFSPDDGRYINKGDKPSDVIVNVRYRNRTMVVQIS